MIELDGQNYDADIMVYLNKEPLATDGFRIVVEIKVHLDEYSIDKFMKMPEVFLKIGSKDMGNGEILSLQGPLIPGTHEVLWERFNLG